MTPDRARILQDELSFEVGPNEAILITGPSGVGKTSLMRAVAGLWRWGGGLILRPPLGEIMFMPQQPYLVLGSLRDQLEYPVAGGLSNDSLIEALEAVKLGERGRKHRLTRGGRRLDSTRAPKEAELLFEIPSRGHDPSA